MILCKPMTQPLGAEAHRPGRWREDLLMGKVCVPWTSGCTFYGEKLWASVAQGMEWAWRLTGGCPGDGEVAVDRLVPTTNLARAHLGKALWILQSHPHLGISLWSNG